LLTPRPDFYIHSEPTTTIRSENNSLLPITYLVKGEYLDAINNAGLRKVETTSTKDVFAGAGGEASAKQFETMGANIRAIKP